MDNRRRVPACVPERVGRAARHREAGAQERLADETLPATWCRPCPVHRQIQLPDAAWCCQAVWWQHRHLLAHIHVE